MVKARFGAVSCLNGRPTLGNQSDGAGLRTDQQAEIRNEPNGHA